MIAIILIILFSVTASLESASYGLYEITANKNKVGGIILIVLSLVGVFLPILFYLQK